MSSITSPVQDFPHETSATFSKNLTLASNPTPRVKMGILGALLSCLMVRETDSSLDAVCTCVTSDPPCGWL